MLTPRKRLGQHFLTDPNTARKIIDSLAAARTDPIVEIGPGTGALTGLLAERFDRVTALEVDPRAADMVRARFPAVTVLQVDVLSIDFGELAGSAGAPLHVIGNLPYNITSQILFAFIDAADAIAEAVVMTQLEVAQRIVAEPRTKAYGILSVALRLACRPTFLFPVSRNVFRPKPDVRSAVLHLDFAPGIRSSAITNPDWTRRVIRSAFNQRRKTLRNSLRDIQDECGRKIPEDWAGRRAEELSPEDFVRLARYLQTG